MSNTDHVGVRVPVVSIVYTCTVYGHAELSSTSLFFTVQEGSWENSTTSSYFICWLHGSTIFSKRTESFLVGSAGIEFGGKIHVIISSDNNLC